MIRRVSVWPPSAVYTWTPDTEDDSSVPVDFDVYAPDDDQGRVTALVIVHFALTGREQGPCA